MSKFITIDDFENLTKQQMFDMAAKHILTTKKKSVSEHGACLYSGSGCAASVFIKPEFRKTADDLDSLDGTGWSHLVCENLVPDHLPKFVVDLQVAHDCSDSGPNFLTDYVQRMCVVAARYKLDSSILDKELV